MYVECRSQENLTKNKTLFDEKLIVVKMKCTVNYRIDDAALHVSHFSIFFESVKCQTEIILNDQVYFKMSNILITLSTFLTDFYLF